MKSLCRRQIMVTSLQNFPEDILEPLSFFTLRTEKYRDFQIHVFGDGKEINTLSCLYNHTVMVKASVNTFVTFYTVINGRLEWLESLNTDLYASAMLQEGIAKTFHLKFKTLVVATNRNCILKIDINVLGKHSMGELDLQVKNKDGHALVLYPNSKEVKLMCKISKENHIPRQVSLLSKKNVSPFSFNVSSVLHYYVNLGSLLTISNDVDTFYRCLPYSVNLLQNSGYKARLHYDIVLTPSAGSTADITITAVESLSSNSYTFIQDEEGKALVHAKTGIRVEGTFIFPLGTKDVGLHIYTPNGFSVDVGENPNTALAHFLDFSVSYVSI